MGLCKWANSGNELMLRYHDEEWGTPCHDNRMLFELLSLEVMQSGLSWQTVLNKRKALKEAFCDFDYAQVSSMNPLSPDLLENSAIIRNKRKIAAIIHNARVVYDMQQRGISFDDYLWKFVDFKPIDHRIKSSDELPATDELAVNISKSMKSDGFSFVGPVVVYSFLEGTGVVNDHEVNCFRYLEIMGLLNCK
ncbi:DNA-3-methyladenine glycosylase I [Alloscardovia theropitheci]|uniref:DNA-3-methyladenine glycosylase I n=1 Tax=Alloscardovia theropitheci TaxID=2496842 RepID=A0A4R0QYQ7_9BIFI|nr:DNA-3-methyladenine glycosylase I [Alloscardovia theropitheci]TCD54960.1 DNA-3-methyladenine glycosylase I [Alloscardovia theropitheci]